MASTSRAFPGSEAFSLWCSVCRDLQRCRRGVREALYKLSSNGVELPGLP